MNNNKYNIGVEINIQVIKKYHWVCFPSTNFPKNKFLVLISNWAILLNADRKLFNGDSHKNGQKIIVKIIVKINVKKITWAARELRIKDEIFALKEDTQELYDYDSYKRAIAAPGNEPTLVGKLIKNKDGKFEAEFISV